MTSLAATLVTENDITPTVPAAEKVIVPTCVPFFLIVNIDDAVAATCDLALELAAEKVRLYGEIPPPVISFANGIPLRNMLMPFIIAAWTNAVVAICVLDAPATAVGADGVPVNVGDAVLAFPDSPAVTNAVVAICVVLVPAVAVGAVGTPVNAGESRGAPPPELKAETPSLLIISLTASIAITESFY